MQFSPKLKSVKKQIEKILKDNDVAGVVVLHTKQYGAYYGETLYHFEVSKSCAKIVNGEMKISVRKAEPEKAEYTSSMLNTIGTIGGELMMNVLDSSKLLDDHVGGEHWENGFTPDTLSDN